jgi:hypothetical protein
MANQIVLMVLINLLIVLCIYFCGGFLLNILHLSSKDNIKNNFISLLVGYIALVTLVAIFVTKGVTSYIALIPIFIYLIKTKNKRTFNNVIWQSQNLKSVIATLSIFTILTTLLQLFVYTGFHSKGVFIPEIHNDFIFYSNVSAHIHQTGQENYYLNSNVSGMFLYHYSEMYLTILSHFLNGSAYIQNYLFSTIPIFFTLVWYGFYTIALPFWNKKNSVFLMLISASCFFVAPIREFVFPFQNYLRGDIYDHVFSSYYKLSIILLFVLGLYHTINNTYYREIILLTLSIVYPTVLPAVIAMLATLIILDLIKRKRVAISFIICQLFVFILLALMLYIFRVKDVSGSSIGFIKLYVGDISEYARTIVNITGSSVCKIFLSTLPFTILLLVTIRTFIKKGLVYFIGFSILLQGFGLLAWGLLFRMPDSVQLWFNIYLPIFSLLIFLALIIAINDSRLWVKSLGWILLLTNIILHFPFEEKYSMANDEQKQIINKIQTNNKKRFAFIKAPVEYNSIYEKNVSFGIIGGYFSYFNESFAPICINTTEIAILSEWENSFVKATPFSKWASLKNEPLEKLQLAFIKQNNIQFVLVSTKADIPNLIKQNAAVVLKDSINNFQLVEMKQ